MNIKMKLGQLALVVGGMLPGYAVMAATATGTLNATATIVANCEFTAGNATLPFGVLTVTDLANGKFQTTPATVNITCTNSGTAAKLYGAAVRQMTGSASGVVTYEVYTDSSHTLPLGSTLAAGVVIPADGTQQSVLLYGKTTANQGTKPTGSYAQALALTVEF